MVFQKVVIKTASLTADVRAATGIAKGAPIGPVATEAGRAQRPRSGCLTVLTDVDSTSLFFFIFLGAGDVAPVVRVLA